MFFKMNVYCLIPMHVLHKFLPACRADKNVSDIYSVITMTS